MWEKGESGNIHGRPKKLPKIDDLIKEVLGSDDPETSEAKKILEALLTRAKRGDVRAGEILLDRAYGKAKQPVESDNKVVVTIRHES